MRPTRKRVQATLLLINHIAALHLPRSDDTRRLNVRGSTDNDIAALYGSGLDLNGLLPSWDNKMNIWEYKDKCDSDCTDCPAGHINNKDDCKKCDKCNAGQKPNKARDKCIGENDKDDEDCAKDCQPNQIIDGSTCSKCTDCPKNKKPDASKKKCVYDDDTRKTRAEKAEQQKPRQKRKYRLAKKGPLAAKSKGRQKRKWKLSKKGPFAEKSRERKKKQRDQQTKRRWRMARCLIVVPIAMTAGDEGGIGYAVGFFDEEFVTSSEMDQYWPSDMPDVPDADLNSQEFVDSYVESYNPPQQKRGIEEPVDDERSSNSTNLSPQDMPQDALSEPGMEVKETDEMLHELESRRIGAAIGKVLGKVLGKVIPGLGGKTRGEQLSEKGGVKLAPGNQGRGGRDKQKEGAKEVANDRNWKTCLKGEKAPKA